MPIEKICEVVNQPITKSPYALRTVSSSQNVLDDTAEDVILDDEPMRLSPKEAKFGGRKKWKKAAAEQAGTGRLRQKEYKKKKSSGSNCRLSAESASRQTEQYSNSAGKERKIALGRKIWLKIKHAAGMLYLF